jgi:TonB family protein
MAKSLRKHEVAVPEPSERPAVEAVKRTKLAVLLVTEDDELWPLIGADLSSAFTLKQLDSIDELIQSAPSGQAAIVLWDARNSPDHAAVLSRLHLHSSRYAIIALDDAISTGTWTIPIQQRQVVAHVGMPLTGSALAVALDSAHEEVNSRLALLGDGAEPVPAVSSPPNRPWLVPAIIGGVLAAAVVAYLLTRGSPTAVSPAPTAAATADKVPAVPAQPKAVDVDEKVDALIQKAQQAMLDRHFIDPASGSALSLYREVLIVAPDNGEARQGLQRLSEILIARVQAALDDRKFDVALQFLETARSIDANDQRLIALDEKIATLRAELGPAQILAALNAQNFDRATQLIDEAGRTKALPLAKLNQLRDEVHRRRDEFEVARLLKLVETREQQDHLIDPRNDSAVFYLEQAKQAGASAPAVQAQAQELAKRMTQATRAAIEQRRFADAERIILELHGVGASAATVAALQRELTSRNQVAAQKPDVPQYLELAQARLAQGKLTEPENDSALYYVNQGRAVDPKSSGLAQISGTLQAQILDRARAALDAGDLERSEALAQSAGGLGGSADLDALNERIRQRKVAAGDVPQLPEQSLTRLNKLDVQYPTRALQDNTEGWVEVAYVVKADGTVTNVRVVNSAPSKIFDSSASRAVSRLKYQPVVQGGKAVPIGTELRIVYRTPK